MASETLTMPVHYVRQIAEQVRRRGGAIASWLAASGIAPSDLAATELAIDFDTFAVLVNRAIAVTGEPAFGLFVGEGLPATMHGMLGYAALSSGTIREALALIERFTPLRTSLVSIRVAEDERDSALVQVRFVETRPLGDVRRPVLEAVVLSVKNILGAISTGACRVTQVVFPFPPPDYAPLARELFGTDVRYDEAWAGLVLPVADLDIPLKMGDPEAFREAALICQRELDKLTTDESLAARVRRALLERQAGFPSLPVTARLFHMTPRTLHRRLLDEGTSYRALLEEVRRALAVEHVRSGRFRMEEIAYSLGYSDLANFRRAFKRWESMPPSAYVSAPPRGSPRKRKR